MRRAATLLLLLSATLAQAGGAVYLNGVNLEGTRDLNIEKASVRIDSDGNVHITAAGYQVQRMDGAGDSSGAGRTIGTPLKPTKRYWMATENSSAGLSGYDVDVYINGEMAFRIRQTDPQMNQEITRRLRLGSNSIRFVARKVGAPIPDVGSRTPYVRIVMGEGMEQGNQIMLEKPSVQLTRTASEAGDRTQEAVLEAK